MRSKLTLALTLAALLLTHIPLRAQAPLKPVLVELFTSEGCSSCPPADNLLSQMNGKHTAEGQWIVTLSEHVTYWNQQGWTDPWSKQLFTDRQAAYGRRFHLDDVYTPQMIVNGAAQVSGNDVPGILKAIREATPPAPIGLHIVSSTMAGNKLQVSYAVDGPAAPGIEIYAVIADDSDNSSVRRGENSGKTLTHVSVARALVRLGSLKDASPAMPAAQLAGSVPLPGGPTSPRHLILFAQESGQGRILGVDSRPL